MRDSMRTGTAGTQPDADLERRTTGAHDAGHSVQLLPQKHHSRKIVHPIRRAFSRALCTPARGAPTRRRSPTLLASLLCGSPKALSAMNCPRPPVRRFVGDGSVQGTQGCSDERTLVMQRVRRIRHVHALQKYIVYLDCRWVVDNGEALVTEHAKEVARRLLRLAVDLERDQRADVLTFAARCEQAPATSNMLRPRSCSTPRQQRRRSSAASRRGSPTSMSVGCCSVLSAPGSPRASARGAVHQRRLGRQRQEQVLRCPGPEC